MTVVELFRDTYTVRMYGLEEELGVPIREVIVGRLHKHRTLRGAARSMGVTHETLRQWCKRLDIEVRYRRGLGGPM